MTNIQIEEKTTASAFTIGTRNIGISDISGYKNNGTTVLTTSPSYAVSRIGSGAFYFNGSNYISYTNTLPSGLTQE